MRPAHAVNLSTHRRSRRVRWFHVPKSGSPFINVLARFACPSLIGSNVTFVTALNFSMWRNAMRPNCSGLLAPWQGHTPALTHERAQGARPALVGLFRTPAQRLLSGFYHTEGGVQGRMIAPGMSAGERARMQHAARGDAGAYARWPGVAGCATKMLLGSPCASHRALAPQHASMAVHVLQESFAFVGLLEHWAVSVCVFHAIMMRGSPPDDAELVRTHVGSQRRAISQGSTTTRTAAAAAEHFRYDERELRGFIDTHDERVYAAASTRFWMDARRTRCVPTRTLTPAA